jgi:demethylmenaquinone methyltransferase / 2-methoxy-6-polyprenyl-1,4-benzoquinol methylase
MSVTQRGAAAISAARPRTVARMFGRIAPRYDLLNTLMTFGMDAGWRRRAVAAAALSGHGRALDVGTGTGALALAVARAVPGGSVVGVDFAGPMIARAPGRAAAAGLDERTDFAQADALRLPFPDRSFDAVTSAFVVRNVADLGQAFREQARVLRPGGRVVCVELTRTRLPVFRHLFAWYFHRWVPLLGALVAGDAAAYTYLPESLDRFPRPSALADVMREAGLRDVRYELLGMGTVSLHVGRTR